jgi:hypothetical protein
MVDFSVKLFDPTGTKDFRKSHGLWWLGREAEDGRDGRQGRK